MEVAHCWVEGLGTVVVMLEGVKQWLGAKKAGLQGDFRLFGAAEGWLLENGAPVGQGVGGFVGVGVGQGEGTALE